ncbi:MAG: amidophosphoribosyltransferase [Bacillota bacterium]|nr:amidophosphoribosyltransferase [Bacillota bacterium]
MNADKLKDECGVVGIYSKDRDEISKMLYYGLISLQHRGQESAGIAVKDNKEIKYYKEMGLVKEVFSEEILNSLKGEIGIGHVRYSTTGESFVSNAQPLVVHYKGGKIALAHNGNLINAIKIRDELEDKGSIFQTSIDSEVIANLIARNYKYGIKESLIKSFELLKGSFALVIIYEDKLIGARDPKGIRPLSIGKLDGDYILSSETCNFDILGADFVRDVEPGEIVIIDDNGIESVKYADEKKALCSFEYVYFARPDSNIDGVNVYKARVNAGKILAKESFVEADIVAAVPDSGTPAAIGFSQESGIPYDIALIKNKYMGRTFINPDQKLRELGVRLKLNVAKENIKGKRIVLVDDSIVRGTTSKRIIRMLRKAGAKEVHFRISSPPVKYSCYFGIDTPSKKHLVGAMMTTDEICKEIGADSLAYISIEGLVESIGMGKDNLCTACFNGEYPMEVPKMSHKFVFEKR